VALVDSLAREDRPIFGRTSQGMRQTINIHPLFMFDLLRKDVLRDAATLGCR
jgi:hypothetical protein